MPDYDRIIVRMSTSETIARLLPERPEYSPKPKTWVFWRDSFIIFWVFSLIGHLMEYPWIGAMNAMGQDLAYPPFFVIAVPYGFGALAILWFVYPFIMKRKIGPIMVFILSAVVCTIIEFICALIPYFIYGQNVFWDYSDQFMNLFGFVCLKNSIAFGLIGLLFVYVLYPLTARVMKNLGNSNLNKIFWVLAIGYVAARLYLFATTGNFFA